MSAKQDGTRKAAPESAVVIGEDQVRMLAEALAKAAAALREAERLMVAFAPQNALKAEKLAEEYEQAVKVIREEKLGVKASIS